VAHTYKYARAALTVDCVVFGLDDEDLKVLLIRRGLEPYAGSWALPGGFVRVDETLEAAARRELHEEAGLENVFLEQLYSFGALERDPRERVVTVAYFALVKRSEHAVRAATDAADVRWYPARRTPKLAFDHRAVLNAALERLRGKVRYAPIGFELLDRKFTLSQLQNVYEKILGRSLDKRNFRKKILSFDLLIELNEQRQGRAGRPAKLYRFDRTGYRRLQKSGFLFEV